MLISHWSSDVCSSDLGRSILCRFAGDGARTARYERAGRKASEVRGATFSPLKGRGLVVAALALLFVAPAHADTLIDNVNGITLDKDGRLVRFTGLVIDTEGKVKRSEEHTSELQSLMRISYAVFCLKKKKTSKHKNTDRITA